MPKEPVVDEEEEQHRQLLRDFRASDNQQAGMDAGFRYDGPDNLAPETEGAGQDGGDAWDVGEQQPRFAFDGYMGDGATSSKAKLMRQKAMAADDRYTSRFSSAVGTEGQSLYFKIMMQPVVQYFVLVLVFSMYLIPYYSEIVSCIQGYLVTLVVVGIAYLRKFGRFFNRGSSQSRRIPCEAPNMKLEDVQYHPAVVEDYEVVSLLNRSCNPLYCRTQ